MYEYLKGIITKITAKYIVLETMVSVISCMWPIPMPTTQDRSIKKLKFMCTKWFVRTLICFMVFAQKTRKALSQSDLGLRDWSLFSSAIIAADDNAGLVQAIETKNITYLTKFPKIGKKTAQQMVLDLEGKVVVAGDDLPAKVAVAALKPRTGRSYGSHVGIGLQGDRT